MSHNHVDKRLPSTIALIAPDSEASSRVSFTCLRVRDILPLTVRVGESAVECEDSELYVPKSDGNGERYRFIFKVSIVMLSPMCKHSCQAV